MFGFFARKRSARADGGRSFRKLLDDAESGAADAQLRVARSYGLGTGVKRDPVEAARWYRRAAEGGDVRAQFELANLYAGAQELGAHQGDAVLWWTRAAERGVKEAQYNLALALGEGRLAAQDLAASAKWCRRAAEQGFADAQLWLGLLYRRGQGVRPDNSEALKWILGAADQGHAVAQHTLALLLHDIFGAHDDCADLHVEAYMWSSIASDKLWGENQAASAALRGALAQKLTGAQIAEAERRARQWRPMPSSDAGPSPDQAATSAPGAGGVQAAYFRQK